MRVRAKPFARGSTFYWSKGSRRYLKSYRPSYSAFQPYSSNRRTNYNRLVRHIGRRPNYRN